MLKDIKVENKTVKINTITAVAGLRDPKGVFIFKRFDAEEDGKGKYKAKTIGSNAATSDLSKADDCMSANFLILMIEMLYCVSATAMGYKIPIKIVMTQGVTSFFHRLFTCIRYAIGKTGKYAGKGLRAMLADEYYRTSIIKEDPDTPEKQALYDKFKPFVSDEYLNRGLIEGQDARTKANIIQCLKNQVPRIFHTMNEETIGRLEELVAAFLDLYLVEGKNGLTGIHTIKPVSLFETKYNTIKFFDDETGSNEAAVLKALSEGQNLSVKFDDAVDGSNMFQINGTISFKVVQNKKEKTATVKVWLNPVIGEAEKFTGETVQIGIIKRYGKYEKVTIPVMLEVIDADGERMLVKPENIDASIDAGNPYSMELNERAEYEAISFANILTQYYQQDKIAQRMRYEIGKDMIVPAGK